MREKWLLPVALGLSLAAGVFLVYSYSQWRQVIPLPAANRGKEAIVDQADLPTPHVQDGAELNGVYFNPFSPGSVELERADLRHSAWYPGYFIGAEILAIVESARSQPELAGTEEMGWGENSDRQAGWNPG